MDEESMFPDIELGLSLAEMIFKFSKKSFKWNWGEYKAEIIKEFRKNIKILTITKIKKNTLLIQNQSITL